jgi:hypothetical protein
VNTIPRAYISNTNQPCLTRRIGNLNPAVLAGAINANGTFLTNLIGALDTNVLAGAIASNGTFLTNLIVNLGGPTYSARGQALVNALNATGVDYNNDNAPITFFDQLVIQLHANLNLLNLSHIEGKVEGFIWDANGGAW